MKPSRLEDDPSRSSGLLTPLARKLWKAAERPEYEMYACMSSLYARARALQELDGIEQTMLGLGLRAPRCFIGRLRYIMGF